MQALVKQPSEALKRQLPIEGAAAIVAIIDVTAASRGLVAGSAPIVAAGSLTAGALFIHVSGGTDGERYLITAQVEDAAGETREGELELVVLDGAWTTPDGGAPYLSIAEFVAKCGLEETVRMTDVDGSGRIDRGLLVGALGDAQAVADAFISAVYAVPLAEVPQIVKVAIADMARARLYPRGAPEGIDGARKAALALLERISKGQLPLPASAPIAAAPSSSPILIQPGRRQYPDGLKDY
ncbi:MAG TPA: phage protein Gp36 family protein [Allosphingosinicella sp.]|jgi:phage gp36-like protein